MGDIHWEVSWFVLQSKSRKEFFLLEQLQQREIRTYFPCLHVKRVNPRARKIEPYFPGYIFFQADLQQLGITTFQHMPGAAGLVRFGNDIAIVEDQWVRWIQQKIDASEEKLHYKIPEYKRGDKIIVHSGIFAGYEAIFDSFLPGSERVRLLLQWLENRYVQVEIPSVQIFLQKRLTADGMVGLVGRFELPDQIVKPELSRQNCQPEIWMEII